MHEELPPGPPPPSKPVNRFKFLAIALGPIPLGLLVFTMATVFKFSSDPLGAQMALILMGLVTLGCSMIGSLGLSGSFEKDSRPVAWIGGIALGLILFVVNVFIIFFTGCALTSIRA